MNSNAIRVRFAPSPTGFLHIGGVRTALFNYLFAKQTGGKYLLRIEDTDTERSEARFTQDILSSLKWLSMEAEEPIMYQSTRFPVYQKIANDLIEKGLAYRCYCTEVEVEAMREQMMKAGQKPMYNRTCRERKEAPAGREKFAIRAKFPLTGETAFTDMIRGEIKFPNTDLDDFVMIRSNGVPTYNYVVVVDDIEMKISHVIRGDDHINNTPKQIYLYDVLKATKPLFAHLPMILGQDKKKLSKRNGETSTNAYRAEGFLPDALLNFLVRLGWSHGDQELFTREEMIEFFKFENVQVSGAVFNPEKLLWISGEHIKKTEPSKLLAILKEDFGSRFPTNILPLVDSPLAVKLVPFLQPKVKKLTEIVEHLVPLITPSVMPVDGSDLKWNKDPAAKAKIKEAIRDLLKVLDSKAGGSTMESLDGKGLDHATVDLLLRGTAEKFGLKLGDLTQPMRLFVTGQVNSAIGLFDLIPVMPWNTLKARIEQCLSA